jgi:RNA polymerase sigma factor (sigma-70 family)
MGLDPRNRTPRQQEIVGFCINGVEGFLYRLAEDMLTKGVRIPHGKGRMSFLSLRGFRIEYSDLVGIAKESLNKNFHKYRPRNEFSMFVNLYAANAMHRRGLVEHMPISIPMCRLTAIRKIVRDGDEEIDSTVRENRESLKRLFRGREENLSMIGYMITGNALDLFGGKGGDYISEWIADDGESVEEIVDRRMQLERVERVLDGLPERDRTVFVRNVCRGESLVGIGRGLNRSRERIRQIRNRVIKEGLGARLV